MRVSLALVTKGPVHLRKIVSTRSFLPFVWYRLALGSSILVGLLQAI